MRGKGAQGGCLCSPLGAYLYSRVVQTQPVSIARMGFVFRLLGGLLSLVGYFWALKYVMDWIGLAWAIVGFFLFPLTAAIVPVVAGLRDGEWRILCINLVSWAVFAFGRYLSGRKTVL